MSVSASVVYSLSEKTGLGIEICKLALEKAKNDYNEAIKIINRWNISKEKKSNANAKEFGATCTYFDACFNSAVALKVTCNNELFVQTRKFYELVGQIATELVAWGSPYVAESESEALEKEHNLSISIESEIFKRKNNLCLLTTYSHNDNIAVILETEVKNDNAFNAKEFRLLSFDIAMHIAANNPISISKEDIPSKIKNQKSIEIERELAREGKELRHWAVASEGKMSKWIEQNVLLKQNFIKNEKETIEQVLKKYSEIINSEITINRFATLYIER